MKRSVEVEIAGQRLTIRSDEGPEYVAELAEYVDAHLQALGGRKTVSPHRVALLVEVRLAGEVDVVAGAVGLGLEVEAVVRVRREDVRDPPRDGDPVALELGDLVAGALQIGLQ